MFHQNRHQRPSESKQKQLPIFHAACRHTARTAIFSGAAILVPASIVAPMLLDDWQRQPASLNAFSNPETDSALSLNALVIEPETSALRLERLSADSEERLR